VSDLFVSDYVGGGELTTEAIIEGTNIPVIKAHSASLTKEVIDNFSDRYWIFGNCANISTELLLHITKTLNYSVIEYDYKFCSYRLREKHIAAEGSCECHTTSRSKMFSIFFSHAKSLWFMSAKQRDIYYEMFPFLKKPTTKVLSSVFNKETLSILRNLSKNKKDDKWLIQRSPSWVKGSDDAVKYAKENGLKYEEFSNVSYKEMLKKFSMSKGFLFLPQGSDTCPRTVIEAKLLGCELILNDNVQHKDEEWFSGSVEKTFNYLEDRTKIFWESIMSDMGDRVPLKTDSKESIHFKVIIPVYNSEEWLIKCVESVKNQTHNNFQCLVGDDISTDKTFEVCSEYIDSIKDDRFTIIQNSEKKYALQNIYDLIESSKPSAEDVIVVLDGDDWFTNNHVLDKLNEIYQEENCWLTYGSFVNYPQGFIGTEASEYPASTISSNEFRTDNWRASHLKTFQYFLWNKIDTDDLKDESGKFYEVSYDQAMMLPMMEMSGNRIKYVPQVLYVYNTSNPNAVNKTRQQKQYNTMLEIRKQKKYEKIDNEYSI